MCLSQVRGPNDSGLPGSVPPNHKNLGELLHHLGLILSVLRDFSIFICKMPVESQVRRIVDVKTKLHFVLLCDSVKGTASLTNTCLPRPDMDSSCTGGDICLPLAVLGLNQ